MSAFGSNEHLALMGVLWVLGLVYWAARSLYRWWHIRPLSHWKIRRLRIEANTLMSGATEQPAPGTPSLGAGPDPLPAAPRDLSNPSRTVAHPPRGGQGQTPVDAVRTPDTATSTGLTTQDAA